MQKRLILFILCGAALLVAVIGGLSPSAADGTIKRVYFSPVAKHFAGQVGDQPGNIRITYSDGRDVPITHVRRAVYDLPKASPDRHTAAWLEGEYVTPHMYAATSLVVYRSGRPICRIRGQKAFIEIWYFWNSGKQIALKSRNGHGPAVAELHDTTTGRLAAQVNVYEITKASPAWCQGLTDGG